jgi:2-dehydro-3-deoxygluconokinase
VAHADRLGISIAFENLEGPEFLAALLRRYGDCGHVGYCWDSGHELCYAPGWDFLSHYGDRLLMTHLNDNLGISDPQGEINWLDDLHLLPYDGMIDWEYIFGTLGVRHFHTGGIFAALSDTTPEVVIEALTAAKKYGTVTSYDLNYRPSLWQSIGGKARAQEVNRQIAPLVDVMIGNEEDFTASLGFEVKGTDSELKTLPVEAFKNMIEQVVQSYPNFNVVATTLRTVKTATVNDWGAIAWSDGKFARAIQRDGLEIMDRVGGGDSFASGLIYGLMTYGDLEKAVNCGAAHGALAMTTPGDTSMALKSEVEKLMAGGNARVDR